MHSLLKQKAAMIAAALLCVNAHAGLVRIGSADIAYASPVFDGAGSDTARIFFPAKTGGSDSLRVRAGRLSGSATSAGFDANIFYEDADLVYLYCIDLYERIGAGWNVSYDVYTLADDTANSLVTDAHPERNFDRTLAFLGALNYTLASSYAHLGFAQSDYNWLNPTAAWMSGAIQFGIWESLYENVGGEIGSWDIFSGDFRVAADGGSGNSVHSEGAELLARTFANLGEAGVEALGSQHVLVLTSDSRQDMIAGDPPVSVAAPATCGLFLAGLLFLAGRRAVARGGAFLA